MSTFNKLSENVKTELERAVEFTKNETTRLFDAATNAAKQRIEDIKVTGRTRMEVICEKAKGVTQAVVRDLDQANTKNIEAIRGVEDQTVKTLDNIWKESKNKIEIIYNKSVLIVGEVLFENLKLILTFLENIMKRCSTLIHLFAQEAIGYMISVATRLRRLEDQQGSSATR